MIQSNINIRSNVYIRTDTHIQKDHSYIAKVTGAKRLKEISELHSVCMTDTQNKIIRESSQCFYAKNGESSYGPVMKNGVMEWENRCEYTDCPRYTACRAGLKPIHRIMPNLELLESTQVDAQRAHTVLVEKYDADIETSESEARIAAKSGCILPDEPTAISKISFYTNFEICDAAETIVESPLDTHVLLNSAPGTGKTNTIVRRIEYLISAQLCAPNEIYVFCDSLAVKQYIASKIAAAVKNGNLVSAAQHINLLTFDAFATMCLADLQELGVIQTDFRGYDANARIALLNRYITQTDVADMHYFIVDDIQNLVNARAELVLKILSFLSCGYLLAGDFCESVYDYAADQDAKMDSVKFYTRLMEQLPHDVKKYEMTVNWRQSRELAGAADDMRNGLSGQEDSKTQNQYAARWMQQYMDSAQTIETYLRNWNNDVTHSTAILCYESSEASYLSGLLCKRGIVHTLNRDAEQTIPLPRWIADVLWDDCNDVISKTDFLTRIQYRCAADLDVEAIWNQLCQMVGSQTTIAIDLSKLRRALAAPDTLPLGFVMHKPSVTVSTVQKARGSEFDNVILVAPHIQPMPNSAEDARIFYVAFTRARKHFTVMKRNKQYFKRLGSGRTIEMGYKDPYTKHNAFCKAIMVGLCGDMDTTAFVSGDFDAVLNRQDYIANHIKPYDKLRAKLVDDQVYQVYHADVCIGALSNHMVHELRSAIYATDYRDGLPIQLDEIYVEAITTEILSDTGRDMPVEFQITKICYGIRIAGMATLTFEQKRK